MIFFFPSCKNLQIFIVPTWSFLSNISAASFYAIQSNLYILKNETTITKQQNFLAIVQNGNYIFFIYLISTLKEKNNLSTMYH